MANEITIVIADDHPIVRKGLRQIIEEEADLRVIAEAADGEASLSLIEKLQPHVAVLDLDMPKLDGFAVAREIRKRNLAVKLLFLTIHGEVDLLHRAMDLGAMGYILKESALIEIVTGIRSVAAGRPFVTSSMTADLLQNRARAQALDRGTPELGNLTVSERRILAMVAEGKPTKVIAAELYVDPRTVETHRASICHKLHLGGTNSLLRFALEHKSELLS
ncbi:MAG: response regulator transcription factor [Deltaproteobacteria bacterium]|nr:response regulator transcription factor [Deltaproteobacteria bacterium]